MHVMHVIQSLEVGGLERMVVVLARALARLGIDGSISAYDGTGPLEASCREARIPVRTWGKRAGLRYTLPRALSEQAARVGADVIHTHHLGPFLYGNLASLGARRPLVHTEHSHEFYDSRRRRLLGHWMHKSATVVAVSHEIADFHAAHFGIKPRVVPNGVEISSLPSGRTVSARQIARRTVGACDDGVVIGCVARLAPEKRVDRLIAALACAPLKNARLCVVGDGPMRDDLEQMAASLGVRDRVYFAGFVLAPEELLPAFDVCVLTSEREGLPLALLEAMAQRVLVGGTAVGEMPRLFAEQCGFLFSSTDPQAMAETLATELAMPESVLEQRRERAWQRVRRSMTADAMAASYAEIYHRAHRNH